MTGKSQPLIRASEPAAALPIARLRKSCRLVKSLPMFAPYGVFKPSLEIAELQRICLDKTGFMSSNSQVCAKSRIPSTLSISRFASWRSLCASSRRSKITSFFASNVTLVCVF